MWHIITILMIDCCLAQSPKASVLGFQIGQIIWPGTAAMAAMGTGILCSHSWTMDLPLLSGMVTTSAFMVGNPLTKLMNAPNPGLSHSWGQPATYLTRDMSLDWYAWYFCLKLPISIICSTIRTPFTIHIDHALHALVRATEQPSKGHGMSHSYINFNGCRKNS